jgi:glycosyltransferase involved in cell wall biosynthesis
VRGDDRLRIAIDASAIPKQMAGAGVYTYELIRALAALGSRHELFIFAKAGVFDGALQGAGTQIIHVQPGSRGGRLIWEQTQLPLLLRRFGIDVLHSPHHHAPVAVRALPHRPKLIVTIHDLTFMLIPERYPVARRLYMQTVTRTSARIADAIITPSQSVRGEVIERLGVEEERVVEIPEAASDCYRPVPRSDIDAVRARYGLPPRYVLSVGSLEPGKNRARLFRAMASLRGKGIECHVAVVGQPAWKYGGDYDLVHALGLSGQVSFLGYVPERDMPALYTGATLLAFPSLHEGFGLPVLEAMACGTPVVTSSVSATAEVAGDAALLVDPLDTAAIAGAIERLLTEETLRAALRERGLLRSAEFSWERTARETLLLYELVANR